MDNVREAALKVLHKELSDASRIGDTAKYAKWLDLCTLAGGRPIDRSRYLALAPEINAAMVPPTHTDANATTHAMAKALLGLMDAEGNESDQWLDAVTPQMIRAFCEAIVKGQ